MSQAKFRTANATWLEGRSLWVTSHTVPLFNIWYYAARIMPLYRARRLNATGTLGVTLPPITAADMLYIPSPAEYHRQSTWESVFSSVVTGVSDVRLEFSDTDFMKQWTGRNLMCVRNAVVLGTFGFVVSEEYEVALGRIFPLSPRLAQGCWRSSCTGLLTPRRACACVCAEVGLPAGGAFFRRSTPTPPLSPRRGI